MKLKSLEKKFYQDPKKIYFFPLANAYREVDRLDDCIKIFRQGLSLFPHYWAARVALGRVLFEKGDIDEALKELETASVHVPENFLLHELLASIYLRKGDLLKATHHGELVLFVNPHHAEALRIKEEILKIEGMDSQKGPLHKQEKTPLPEEKEKESLPEKQEDETGFVFKKKDEEKESLISKEEDKKEFFTQEQEEKEAEGEEEKEAEGEEEKEAEGEEEKQRESFPLKQEEEIITATLAELYISQGLPERAIEIYQKLIKQQPEREEEWKKRIAAIQEIQGAAVSAEIFAPEEEAAKKKNTHESILQQLEMWLKNIEKFEKSK